VHLLVVGGTSGLVEIDLEHVQDGAPINR
jgi:hypothetical protein